jgi:hypothetical protein
MDNDSVFEKEYWGDCCNTFDEEQKHYTYAKCMQIPINHYTFNANGKTVLDIGGGPVSMLLKTYNLKRGKVVDPLSYPAWTKARYRAKKIEVKLQNGEDITDTGWDEVWLYNCLQHTIDPAKIIANAKRAAPTLRFFEWINVPAHEGHPHLLTREFLEDNIGMPGGNIIELSNNGCYGTAFYGAFFNK